MSIVPVEGERFQTMEKAANLAMHGKSEFQIAKELGLRRVEVKSLLEDYRAALANDNQARDMARDHLNMMGKHYDNLIKKFYDLLDELNELSFTHNVAGQKNAALKAIAELEAKRLDAFQKAGLLDSADLGDELIEMEEKHEILVNILQDDLCPDCRMKVAHKLTQVTGKVQPIAEYDVEVVDA